MSPSRAQPTDRSEPALAEIVAMAARLAEHVQASLRVAYVCDRVLAAVG